MPLHPAFPAHNHSAGMDEREPQLKFEQLGSDVRRILSRESVTCMCLSEKILALGTEKGRAHLLDYSGNEVGRGSEGPGVRGGVGGGGRARALRLTGRQTPGASMEC